MHRDVKPANMVLVFDSESCGTITDDDVYAPTLDDVHAPTLDVFVQARLMLADFGVARLLPQSAVAHACGAGLVDRAENMTASVGTPQYRLWLE